MHTSTIPVIILGIIHVSSWFPLFLPLLFSQALAGSGRLFSRVKSILNTQPLLQVDYIATDRTLETLSANETELQDAGVSFSQWDPSSLPSGNLTNADLVVYNCSTSVLGNTSGILSNLAAAVKEGGFVLLHTLLKGETLGEIVSFLTSPDLQQKHSFLSEVSLLERQILSQWIVWSLLLADALVMNVE